MRRRPRIVNAKTGGPLLIRPPGCVPCRRKGVLGSWAYAGCPVALRRNHVVLRNDRTPPTIRERARRRGWRFAPTRADRRTAFIRVRLMRDRGNERSHSSVERRSRFLPLDRFSRLPGFAAFVFLASEKRVHSRLNARHAFKNAFRRAIGLVRPCFDRRDQFFTVIISEYSGEGRCGVFSSHLPGPR